MSHFVAEWLCCLCLIREIPRCTELGKRKCSSRHAESIGLSNGRYTVFNPMVSIFSGSSNFLEGKKASVNDHTELTDFFAHTYCGFGSSRCTDTDSGLVFQASSGHCIYTVLAPDSHQSTVMPLYSQSRCLSVLLGQPEP